MCLPMHVTTSFNPALTHSARRKYRKRLGGHIKPRVRCYPMNGEARSKSRLLLGFITMLIHFPSFSIIFQCLSMFITMYNICSSIFHVNMAITWVYMGVMPILILYSVYLMFWSCVEFRWIKSCLRSCLQSICLSCCRQKERTVMRHDASLRRVWKDFEKITIPLHVKAEEGICKRQTKKLTPLSGA